jgi:lysozyme family protein
MQSVEEIVRDIIAREGGFVHDPDDPGGATKYGVTLGTLRRLGMDITGDGAITARDVERLTKAEAAKIFLRNFYDKPGIGMLPEALRASVFDMYVNAGPNAVRILQRLLTMMGYSCAADGVIGPQTIRAAGMAADAAPAHLADAYAIARRNYYYALADARPASRKYARRRDGGKGGWIARAEAFMADRYKFTDAQHQSRVAAWD